MTAAATAPGTRVTVAAAAIAEAAWLVFLTWLACRG
jgi:hypothetical protein